MQDILNRRSLKEILPSKNKTSSNPTIFTGDNNLPPAGDISPSALGRRKPPMFLMWIIIVILAVFLFIILSTVFSKVTIDIVPRQGRIILDNESITAVKQATEGKLEFGLVSSEVEEEITVPATGTKEVQIKASGQITVFNNFDEKPQELVANTRFKTPDGKIYRIQKLVVVPGVTTKDNKSTPGSVEATVYADKPGEGYNVGLTDFTIPGFAGSPRFEKFFARSKTPMTKGFIGKIKTVSSADEKTTREALRKKLSDKASTLKPQVPAEFILFDDALIISFQDIALTPDSNLPADQVKIAEKVVATGILFNKEKLSSYLAKKYISDYDGGDVSIVNLDELKFTLDNKDNLNPESLNSLTFTLSGNAHVVWTINTEAFKDAIRGLNKEEFSNIIANFPAIKSVLPKFRPPWKGTISDNPNKIKINLSIEK